MKIEITRIGNRSLYRDLYEDIDRTTRHRTFTGAARSILKMSREAATLSKTVGDWGRIEVTIDGVTLDNIDAIYLLLEADNANEDYQWPRRVAVMAEKIAAHAPREVPTMTALDIINTLKQTRDRVDPAVLWIDHENREAAVHPGGGTTCCTPIDYKVAMIVRTDPALNIVSAADGETLVA